MKEKPPQHIEFGRRFESKAREMFIASHKFIHRKGISHYVPGLIISDTCSFMATSPDGIMDCKTCGLSLIEVKCLSSKRNYWPKNAMVQLGICTKDTHGNVSVNTKHPYFYQIQAQMAMTDIHLCHLVGYTHKGIHHIEIRFDAEFWNSISTKVSLFFKNTYFGVLKDAVINEYM